MPDWSSVLAICCSLHPWNIADIILWRNSTFSITVLKILLTYCSFLHCSLLFACYFEKNFFSKYGNQLCLFACMSVCLCVSLSVCLFVRFWCPDDPGRIFGNILMKLGRKLRLNIVSISLNFGWPGSRFNVKVMKKPKKLVQCLTAYISLIIWARDAILVLKCRTTYGLYCCVIEFYPNV